MKVLHKEGTVHRVSIDRRLGSELLPVVINGAPAILVTRNAAFVTDMSIAAVLPNDVIAAVDGDWENAILVVLPDVQRDKPAAGAGDSAFLKEAQSRAPSTELATLAAETILAIRSAGVDGELTSKGNGRWVNSPLNSFTLKVQPRAGNIQFTLYGNPDTYQVGGFLLQDQNSYSRGWVRSQADVQTLAGLVKDAHSRRLP